MYVPSRKRLELRSLKCRTVYYAATVVTIAGHALVLAVTWRRTYGIRKLVNASSMGTSLSSLILRDGESLVSSTEAHSTALCTQAVCISGELHASIHAQRR